MSLGQQNSLFQSNLLHLPFPGKGKVGCKALSIFEKQSIIIACLLLWKPRRCFPTMPRLARFSGIACVWRRTSNASERKDQADAQFVSYVTDYLTLLAWCCNTESIHGISVRRKPELWKKMAGETSRALQGLSKIVLQTLFHRMPVVGISSHIFCCCAACLAAGCICFRKS